MTGLGVETEKDGTEIEAEVETEEREGGIVW